MSNLTKELYRLRKLAGPETVTFHRLQGFHASCPTGSLEVLAWAKAPSTGRASGTSRYLRTRRVRSPGGTARRPHDGAGPLGVPSGDVAIGRQREPHIACAWGRTQPHIRLPLDRSEILAARRGSIEHLAHALSTNCRPMRWLFARLHRRKGGMPPRGGRSIPVSPRPVSPR